LPWAWADSRCNDSPLSRGWIAFEDVRFRSTSNVRCCCCWPCEVVGNAKRYPNPQGLPGADRGRRRVDLSG
jgi:hypothetical protein